MKLVTDIPGQPPILWQWMHKISNVPWSSSTRTIGLMREDGSIASAVAFDTWHASSCWMHIVIDNKHGFTKSILRAVFEYPFITCGLKSVYGQTSKNLPEAIKFNDKIGFRRIAETVDCVIFEMNAEDCRWIRQGEKNGSVQEESAAAA